ncbi:unnamed protein product, partial [Prorocentrum cordatum]
DKEQHWVDYAQRLVKTHAALVAEPEAESQDKLQECDGPRGSPGHDARGLLFNLRGAAESIADPRRQIAPPTKERLQKLVSAR